MNKEALLQETYDSAFNDELNKIAYKTEDAETLGETPAEETQQPTLEGETPTDTMETDTQKETTEEELADTIDDGAPGELSSEEIQQPMPVSTINVGGGWELSDVDLDRILEMALGGLSPDERIDMVIDDFIESLKG